MTNEIIIPYAPHPGQKILHQDTHRYKTIVCGRRFGKTTYAVNKLQKCAIIEPGLYAYIAPTYHQAKLISWELLKYFAVKEIVKRINESELFIEYISGGIVRLFGADNPDRLRGLKLKGVVNDEYQDIKRNVWQAIIRPALTDCKGWSDFIGTPKGKQNHLYEMFVMDKEYFDKDYRTIYGDILNPNDDYKSFIFKTIDNPHIDPLEIEKARQELSPQYFRQEYEASFENYTGTIYKELDVTKHIYSFPKDLIKDWWRVFVGIDTGRFTAVSFMAIDDKARAFVFDEVYNYDGRVDIICAEIKHKIEKWGLKKNNIMYIIDSASQVKREYEANKIFCYDSEKDVQNQIAIVRNKLANNSLYFNSDTCKMHIVEHLGYVWNERSKKVEPVKENDHTCNAVQYIFSTYNTRASIDYKAKGQYENSLEYATINEDGADNEYKEKFS